MFSREAMTFHIPASYELSSFSTSSPAFSGVIFFLILVILIDVSDTSLWL